MKQLNTRSIGKLVNILHRHIMAFLDKKLEPFGINSANVHILSILYSAKDTIIKQSSLAQILMIHKCNVTRSIEKLEKEDFIKRWKDMEDGRFYNIQLTAKAVKLKNKIINILKDTTNILTKGMGQEEKKNIIRISNQMIKNISQSEE